MSVAGKSVSDPTPAESYQPVGLVSAAGAMGTEGNPVYVVTETPSGGASLQDVIDAINAQNEYLVQIAMDTNQMAQDTAVMVSVLNQIATNTTPAG